MNCSTVLKAKPKSAFGQIVAAMKASMDGMAILNEREQYAYLNDAHVKTYGYSSAEEFIGKTWKILYDEKELKRFETEIMPAFRKDGRWRGEAFGKKKDGSVFPQELSLTAIESGGLVCVVRDISERKKIECELDNYRKHLEGLVEERTRELRYSERLAATGRLAASIAHEINNPLQGIMTHLEIIHNSLPKEFNRIKNYEFVKGDIEKIKTIVSKLLDSYRGAKENKGAVNVNELIERIVSLMEHQLKGRRIKVKLLLDKNLPVACGWKQQLYQVFLNLILNAQDSIKEQGTITIKTSNDHDYIVVEIMDTGEGIKHEDLDHIFEPFYTTKSEQGTGLGLFVSQGIISEHKGQIKVKSKEGEGSVFTVLLPV